LENEGLMLSAFNYTFFYKRKSSNNNPWEYNSKNVTKCKYSEYFNFKKRIIWFGGCLGSVNDEERSEMW